MKFWKKINSIFKLSVLLYYMYKDWKVLNNTIGFLYRTKVLLRVPSATVFSRHMKCIDVRWRQNWSRTVVDFLLNAKLAKEINEKWKDALLTSCPQCQKNYHNGIHCGVVTLGLTVKNKNRSTIYTLGQAGDLAPVVIPLWNKLDVFSRGFHPMCHTWISMSFETVQMCTESSTA